MIFDKNTQHINFHITGMTCTACASRIEKVLKRMEGIEDVSVHFALGKASVSLDREKITPERIAGKIEQLGFTATPGEKEDRAGSHNGKEISRYRNTFLLSAVLTFPLLWTMVKHYPLTAGIWVPELFLNHWFQLALATPVQFIIGRPFYIGAFNALKHGSANMDVLVALGTSSAYFYSHYLTMNSMHMDGQVHASLYFETSSMIITIVWLGKWLEASAKRRTWEAMNKLQQLQAKTAHVLRGMQEIPVPIEKVEVGDIVVIRPGEQVPVDGQVLRGYSTVDQSMITGEGVPVSKHQGDTVHSGSINYTGMLQIVVTKGMQQSVLSRMIKLIEEAQNSKPSIQRMADTVAGMFVPMIISLSAITFLSWYLLLEPGNLSKAMETAIAVLLIACPCAIGLATPTSILVGSGRAAEQGILFKEGKIIETVHDIDIVLLDKTGTLTEGRPKLTDIITEQGSEMELLRLVAAAEKYSEHPLSQAIVTDAIQKGLSLPEAKLFNAIPGYGISAVVQGKEIMAGTRQFMKQQGVVTYTRIQLMHQLESQGKTVLFIALNGKQAGLMALADSVKPSAKEAVRRLKKLRLGIAMVTGDNRSTALSIANPLRIRQVYAEVLPEEKVELVKKLQARGKKVAMVGDGINDAAALAAADVGIAMGTGTDIAMESADVTLMNENINIIADMIQISRKTMANIRQNLGFALIYNIIAIPFAVIGWLEPWMAGTAMALSSVSVVLNALRLQKVKIK